MKVLMFAPSTEQPDQPVFAILATADEREAAFQRLDRETQIHFAALLAFLSDSRRPADGVSRLRKGGA